MPSEADIQGAIIEALVWDGWLILRVNQGGMYGETTCPACHGVRGMACNQCNGAGIIASRYVRYAWWQVLGMDPQDSGISDVIALGVIRAEDEIISVTGPMILAIEVKAPGKKMKLHTALIDPLREDGIAFNKLVKREKNQAEFLFDIQDHGGIAIVAGDLSDVAPYLDRIEEQ